MHVLIDCGLTNLEASQCRGLEHCTALSRSSAAFGVQNLRALPGLNTAASSMLCNGEAVAIRMLGSGL